MKKNILKYGLITVIMGSIASAYAMPNHIAGEMYTRTLEQYPQTLEEALQILQTLGQESTHEGFKSLIAQTCATLKQIQKSPDDRSWEKIFGAMRELSHAMSQKKNIKRNHYDDDKEKCSKTCALILEELQEQCQSLHHVIEKKFVCNSSFSIDQVPVIIEQPGKYCVTQDLEYNGNGAAITINADNVTLDFSNHNLALLNSRATGIFCDGRREIVLENASIVAPTAFVREASKSIYFANTSKISLSNCSCRNTGVGAYFLACEDINLSNSYFQNHRNNFFSFDRAGEAVSFENCSSINVADCTTTNCRIGYIVTYGSSNFSFESCTNLNSSYGFMVVNPFVFDGKNYNGRFNNCSVKEFTNAAFILGNLKGGSVTRCSAATNAPIFFFPPFQISYSYPYGFSCSPSEDLIISECSLNVPDMFTFIPERTGLIQIMAGKNIIVDTCTITGGVTCQGIVTGFYFFDNEGPSGITLSNNTISAGVGIAITPSLEPITSNHRIVNNTISNTNEVGIIAVEGVHNIALKNNTLLSGQGHGISLTAPSYNNTIQGNTISNQAGTGILVDAASQSNIIQDNIVSNNGVNYSIPNASNSLSLNSVSFN